MRARSPSLSSAVAPRHRLAAASLLLLVMLAPAFASAADRGTALEQSGQQQPDLGAVFREMFGKLADAAPTASEKDFAVLARDLALPNYKAWFARNFGDVAGQKLAARYEELLPKLIWRLRKDLAYTSPGIGTAFGVQLWSKEKESAAQGSAKALLASLKQPTWYYEVAIVPPGRQTRWPFALFFYVDGAYRYLPTDTFNSLGANPPRIRTGGNVQQAKLIQQQRPEYPTEAREKKIQGTVRLEVVLAPLGWVMECKVQSGDPLLVPAAMAAVRKWLYEPTLLNGDLVEVLTIVDVVFTLTG